MSKMTFHLVVFVQTYIYMVEGGLANHHTFYLIFSLKPSLKDYCSQLSEM